MSFRELRNFCEIMRSLGYHRLVSMENFRKPNFELVADILDWLLHRFEPGCAVPDDISTEAHRVQFIKAVCEKVVLRTGLKLNARMLYSADGYAVKELLRLATVLYDAQQSVGEVTQEGSAKEGFTTSQLADLKSTRELCSSIVETGATLSELLQKETDIRQDREKALRFLGAMSEIGNSNESKVVEDAVKRLLGNHGQNLAQLKKMSEELQCDEAGLEKKIIKKRSELERGKKRLGSLASVRPQFMDELEQLEQELERYYEQYVGRFRNLDYLEHEIDVLNREESERMDENERALKRMQKRLRDEEWRLLRGEEDEKSGKDRKPKKLHGQKRWMPPSAVDAVDGSMDPGEEDLSSEVSGSADSDPPISVGGSDDSGGLGLPGGPAGDAPVSIGGSAGESEDDDIVDESDDDISDDGLGDNRPRGGMPNNDFDF